VPESGHDGLTAAVDLLCFQSGHLCAIHLAAMLKITLHDSADEFRLSLEGKLSGAWVGELRQCWQTASSTTQGRRTVVDLREVDFVDDAGEALLCDMTRCGVSLQVSTPFMQAVVEEIARFARYGSVEGKSTSSSDAVVCSDPARPHSRAV
jgi:anti-anti-sigma regulatory factor